MRATVHGHIALTLVVAACAHPEWPSSLSLAPDGGTANIGNATSATFGNTDAFDAGPAVVTSGGTTITRTSGLFQQKMPWTKDVSSMTKDARSDAIIAELAAMGGWGGRNRLLVDFSIPLFFADGSTPRQIVSGDPHGYCYGGPDCERVPLQVPLPANGNTEGSRDYVCNVAENDCHVLVVEPNEKKLYELYNATKTSDGFTALGVFVWDLASAYPVSLRGDQCTSADAAGLPIAALLPTADEVAAGEIKHALRFILPNNKIKARVYVRPATHAGAPSSTRTNAPPYGVRFRLKASFDEKPFNAREKIVLKAMKTYGMLLADGGDIALTFADDRVGTAKWAAQGITAQSFKAIGVSDFEAVDLGAEIARVGDCVRNP